MEDENINFLKELLLECSQTGKELRITQMYDSGEDGFVIQVESEDETTKYKHIITTEEI